MAATGLGDNDNIHLAMPWIKILTLPVASPNASPEAFQSVTENLLRNPNVTSSHLFRADILYDSATEPSASWELETKAAATAEQRERYERKGEIAGPRSRLPSPEGCPLASKFVPHMRKEIRPRWITGYLRTAGNQEGEHGDTGTRKWQWERTVVRELVPRNEQKDRKCAQSCHFFTTRPTQEDHEEHTLVVYVPHVQGAEDTPFYHPSVQALAVLHSWRKPPASLIEDGSATSMKDQEVKDEIKTDETNRLTLYYVLHPSQASTAANSFPSDSPSTPSIAVSATDQISPRLLRTADNLLRTTAKHMSGKAAGYVKRVHHDTVVPQRALQERYAALKQRHAKQLCSGWKESTDPTKHVFEDLGIAAFLIELWAQEGWVGNHGNAEEANGDIRGEEAAADEALDGAEAPTRKKFPGFVDVGCGNGVLVYILRAEGFEGWGFDVRRRKTWSALPRPEVADSHLHEMVCVPRPLLNALRDADGRGIGAGEEVEGQSETAALERITGRRVEVRSGSELPPPREEAAEQQPLVIHDGMFSPGTFIVSNHADELTAWTPLLARLSGSSFVAIPCCSHDFAGSRFRARTVTQPKPPSKVGAESGANSGAVVTLEEKGEAGDVGGKEGRIVKKPAGQPSAYAALCSWVEWLTGQTGYAAEREMLRIPSTRNAAILGRRRGHDSEAEEKRIADIVEREMGMPLADVAMDWVKRGEKLMSAKGSGH